MALADAIYPAAVGRCEDQQARLDPSMISGVDSAEMRPDFNGEDFFILGEGIEASNAFQPRSVWANVWPARV